MAIKRKSKYLEGLVGHREMCGLDYCWRGAQDIEKNLHEESFVHESSLSIWVFL